MKTAYRLYYLLAPVLVFALAATAAKTSSQPMNNAKEATRVERSEEVNEGAHLPNQGGEKTITVILHGLMVGRHKQEEDDKRFEVGIVKGAEDHQFSLSYYTGGQQGCQTIQIDNKRELVFEVRRGNQGVARDIDMWHWHPEASPSCDNDPLKDSKFILNVEGDKLHNVEVARHRNPFKKKFQQIFYFHNGKVKTHTPTVRLLAKRPKEDCQDIGPIAEVAMVEIKVNDGEQLVLTKRKEKKNDPAPNPLWSVPYNEIKDGAEVRLLNLPPEHGHEVNDCTKAYDGAPPKCTTKMPIDLDRFLSVQAASQVDCGELTPTHFQFYYRLVFRKNKGERFELKNPHVGCYEVKKGNETVATVPPYRCGMVLVSKKEIK